MAFYSKSLDVFRPENWKWSWIVGFLCFLLAVNLFGPKGILHYVLLNQQSSRYQDEIVVINQQTKELENKIYLINNSKDEQEMLIREKLGLLKEGEYRVDFINGPENETF